MMVAFCLGAATGFVFWFLVVIIVSRQKKLETWEEHEAQSKAVKEDENESNPDCNGNDLPTRFG